MRHHYDDENEPSFSLPDPEPSDPQMDLEYLKTKRDQGIESLVKKIKTLKSENEIQTTLQAVFRINNQIRMMQDVITIMNEIKKEK